MAKDKIIVTRYSKTRTPYTIGKIERLDGQGDIFVNQYARYKKRKLPEEVPHHRRIDTFFKSSATPKNQASPEEVKVEIDTTEPVVSITNILNVEV